MTVMLGLLYGLRERIWYCGNPRARADRASPGGRRPAACFLLLTRRLPMSHPPAQPESWQGRLFRTSIQAGAD